MRTVEEIKELRKEYEEVLERYKGYIKEELNNWTKASSSNLSDYCKIIYTYENRIDMVNFILHENCKVEKEILIDSNAL